VPGSSHYGTIDSRVAKAQITLRIGEGIAVCRPQILGIVGQNHEVDVETLSILCDRVRQLVREPHFVYNLSPRQFEFLIAELLKD
jgi:hypothetical protein